MITPRALVALFIFSATLGAQDAPADGHLSPVGSPDAQTAADGKLYAGSAAGRVYSLNARTGCIYWTLEAEAPVRTAISIGRIGARRAIYFGDLHANVYAADADTGKVLWKTRVEDHSEARIT